MEAIIVKENTMKQRNKTILYSSLLIIGLLTFILEIFVFQKPDGILGLSICIISIFMVIISCIRLCQLHQTFKNYFIAFLDIFF